MPLTTYDKQQSCSSEIFEGVIAMKPLIAGNWKMNNLRSDASALVAGLMEQRAEQDPGCDMLVCPPFVSIRPVGDLIAGSPIALGGQDCHTETAGAHTGDVSAAMLADAGCEYVIVGHSERRANHQENDALIASKATAAHLSGLTAIVCIGETLEQRNAEETLEIVENQVSNSVPDNATAKNTVIAYEPVWAISRGDPNTPAATPEDAQSVHALIRSLLPASRREDTRILYGGSMKPENAQELLSQPDIDGGLVGGASLKPDAFAEIVEIASKMS